MAVESKAILDRVDKNGTKYYHNNACEKCGGSGYVPYYVDNGVCWDCGGSGYHPHTWSERTPEYNEKLRLRRVAKERLLAPAKNAQFFEHEGFSAEGRTWLPIGNTFEIKDQLKEAGAKYSAAFGWHFSEKPEGFKCFEIDATKYLSQSESDVYFIDNADAIKERLDELRKQYAPKNDVPVSEHIGVVGGKVRTQVTLKRYFCFENDFGFYGGTTYIYHFADELGNVIIWKTSKCLSLEEGGTCTIAGTVKEHSEYKGIKQTVLTRCSVA